ncbi:MAG: hypothetical protein MZV70_47130 [Desulfobacterales bacterium]|nr:hypothetical protein [Desulfobacterales bacterium]
MVDILIRRRQNNPILTGEAGVGKTAVVEGFALRIGRRRCAAAAAERGDPRPRPGAAPGRRGIKGEFENRLKSVINEVKASPAPDHPVHRRGTHPDRRRRVGRAGRCGQPAQAGPGARRAAHHRRHHLVRVQEVLREGRGAGAALPGGQGGGARRGEGHGHDAGPWRRSWRSTTRCMITDEALRDAVRLSHRYLAGRQLPDKAVSVLDTACARVAIGPDHQPAGRGGRDRRRIDQIERELKVLEREALMGSDHAEQRQRLCRSDEGQRRAAAGEL